MDGDYYNQDRFMDRDYYHPRWRAYLKAQADHLANGNFSAVDIATLVEEILWWTETPDDDDGEIIFQFQLGQNVRWSHAPDEVFKIYQQRWTRGPGRAKRIEYRLRPYHRDHTGPDVQGWCAETELQAERHLVPRRTYKDTTTHDA